MSQVDARRKAQEQRISDAMRVKEKERQADAVKTARLKELRLAKEAADRSVPAVPARAARRKVAAAESK